MSLKLDIGCADNKVAPDYIGIDPYWRGADIKTDAWNLPYARDTVDEIYSSHTLEHLAKLQILPTLREWYRVLKPSGRLVIRIPDLEWCCRWWLDHQTTGWDMDIIYGTQGREGEFHKTGFNRQIMEKYLENASFEVVKFEEMETHSQKTLSFECKKILVYPRGEK